MLGRRMAVLCRGREMRLLRSLLPIMSHGRRGLAHLKVVLATGVLSGSIALSAFIFQIVQSWVDNGISKSILRWMLPVSLCGLIVLAASLVATLLVIRRKETLQSETVTSDLARAVLHYAHQLHEQGRYSALVSLRNNFSEIVHIIGLHDLRIRLGELTLEAATILNDDISKAWILVDDLGWANHLIGNDLIAVQNIDRALDVLNHIGPTAAAAEATQIAICKAKGLRHKALMSYRDLDASKDLLDEAKSVLEAVDPQLRTVRRELAQIEHAQGLAIAMRLGIHKVGFLREGDHVAVEELESALRSARRAAEEFNALSDSARYTKTLFLVVRLLDAKRAETEAREVRIVRNRALAQSDWSTEQGIATLTGVEND